MATQSWSQGTILARSSSVSSRTCRPDPDPDTPGPSAGPAITNPFRDPARRQRAGSVAAEQGPGNSQASAAGSTRPRRAASLSERHPGDRSHRPLDMLRTQYRAADRATPVRRHKRQQPSDIIDTLDQTGTGLYHHEGPYDAASWARNQPGDPLSPLDAVNDSNQAALRATPREFVQDSLTKHVPLQGVSTIPPGEDDFSGRRMSYEEGADLMREPDAEGGAYKRWPGIKYRPDDVKGKGEPSFTIEQQLARGSRHRHSHRRRSVNDTMVYEMMPPSTRHSIGVSRTRGNSVGMINDLDERMQKLRAHSHVAPVRPVSPPASNKSESLLDAASPSRTSTAPASPMTSPPASPVSQDVAYTNDFSPVDATGGGLTQKIKRRVASIRRRNVPV